MASDLEDHRDGYADGLLRVTVSEEADFLVIQPRGEIDMTSASIFTDCLTTAATECSQPLLVDLSGVTFMDSTGLDALIHASRLLRSKGQPLRIRHTSATVRQIIEATGTEPLFDLDC